MFCSYIRKQNEKIPRKYTKNEKIPQTPDGARGIFFIYRRNVFFFYIKSEKNIFLSFILFIKEKLNENFLLLEEIEGNVFRC